MSLDIFQSTKHWVYTANDAFAEVYFDQLISQARKQLPSDFFDRNAANFLTHGMKGTKLYQCLKTLPKGVLHNVFLDCCEDQAFFRDIVAKHPHVYVTEDFATFKMGTKDDALKNKWLSMEEVRQQSKSEEEFIASLMGITTFMGQHYEDVKLSKSEPWTLFQKKLSSTATLIFCKDIFPHYVKHVLNKFIRNGYQRVELRSLFARINQYDNHGNFVGIMDPHAFCQLFDNAAKSIQEQNPQFSTDLIICIKKSLSDTEIIEQLTTLCKINWKRMVGIDFTQEEDTYGKISRYDKILENVVSKYPDVKLWKCYHAGQTKNHLSNNIEEAVMAGSIRIGHGLNILQRVQFLPFCKHVCFQKCPISNLLLGYTGDPRESSAPILLGLGYAISINMGDSGKLGAQDSTADFFVSAISYDWTLKHFKLIIQHSINHCLLKEKARRLLVKNFNTKWNAWIGKFIDSKESDKPIKSIPRIDIFTTTNNWRYTHADEKAQRLFESMRERQMKVLPGNFFGKATLTHLQHIRSRTLFKIMKKMPKGAIHHLHFDCTEDEDFYREHIITDPNVYLDKQKKHFFIGTKQEAIEKQWVSFSKLAEEFPNQQEMVKFVANITMLNKKELQTVSGNQHDFWVLFEEKIGNFFPLLFSLHIFKKYVKHVLLKYINCGYDRVEFRALLVQLNEYDEEGKFVKLHDQQMFMKAFDEMYFEVQKTHPNFTSAFIFFGLKADPEEVNYNRLDKACSYGWERMVGIDFVQQEDPYGSMEPYISVGDRILKKYAHMNLKKVYHSGETKDHTNNNVEQAVRSGSVRIGHGLNIVKRIGYLKHCHHVCFELNPISNLLTGGMTDVRMSTAPILLGLGYAVSISPDDPGKFGYQDTTVDLYVSAVSFNWTLKHFKLVAFHSINHSIVTEGQRLIMLESFNQKWDNWVQDMLEQEQAGRLRSPQKSKEEVPEQEQLRSRPFYVGRMNSLN